MTDDRCHPGKSLHVTRNDGKNVRATTGIVTFSEHAGQEVWWALTVNHLFENVSKGAEVRYSAPGGLRVLGVYEKSSNFIELAAVRVTDVNLVARSALNTPQIPNLLSADHAARLKDQPCSFCVDLPNERFLSGVVSARSGSATLLDFHEDSGFVAQFGHSGAPLYIMSGNQRRLAGLLVETLGVPPDVQWTFEYPGLGLAELGIRMRDDP